MSLKLSNWKTILDGNDYVKVVNTDTDVLFMGSRQSFKEYSGEEVPPLEGGVHYKMELFDSTSVKVL